MLRILTKGMSIALAALLLLALPTVALGGEAAVLTNAPANVVTEWGAGVPVVVSVTDEAGNTAEGTLTLATAGSADPRLTGAVELSYEYGATNMPANILYHALLGLNEDVLLRVEGASLEAEVLNPGSYTVTYAYQGDEMEALVCTVRVRGAVSGSVALSDYEVPLGDGLGGAPAPATPIAQEDQEDEPVPDVVVLAN